LNDFKRMLIDAFNDFNQNIIILSSQLINDFVSRKYPSKIAQINYSQNYQNQDKEYNVVISNTSSTENKMTKHLINNLLTGNKEHLTFTLPYSPNANSP